MRRLLHHPDSVAGLALVLVGGVATYLSLQVDAGPSALTLPPNFFPLLCTIGTVVIGVALMVQAARAEPQPQPSLLDRRVAAVLGLMLVYFVTFEHVDFRVGSFVFVLATMLVMGCRSLAQLALVPLGVVAAVYFTFTSLFSILLPTWN
ncbi:tripartite tricarboxylate transporter TctB family protein [Faunimonas sp. B44]|uniref:tripartite tricarboxylate transporter TctB family protein n=1 Tax=Faunimonas sp. B44 TaxID=3461493 RepID=UPI004044E870